MRKIPVLFLAALAAVTCEPAAAERPQREFEPDSSAHSSGNPVRLAGTLPAHSSIVQSKPLHGAEIAERLGLGGGVLVSTWEAGFPKTVTWRPENVVDDGEGGVALRLSISPDPAPRPYLGAEFQAKGYAAVWGRVEWRGRLPAGIPGSVVGMFLYKTPFTAGTDRELDLEYVPGDPKVAHQFGTMQMTLHMKRHDGSGGREKQSYRINVPAHCIEAACGWAIEFQPEYILFQIAHDPGVGRETIGRFSHGTGWDLAAGVRFGGALNGRTRNFTSDEIWSEQTVAAYVSYWCTDDQPGWLGALDERDLSDGAPQFALKSMALSSYNTLTSFGPGDWSLTATGEVAIAGIPDDDLQATAIQYRLDGGDWHDLGAFAAGDYALPPGLAARSVEIRSVARGPAFADSGHEVVSGPSDRKTVPAWKP